jgi:hypothetical protein
MVNSLSGLHLDMAVNASHLNYKVARPAFGIQLLSWFD